MLTTAENERLTKVGPRTPMGELMRRYWHLVAAVAELDDELVADRLAFVPILYRESGVSRRSNQPVIYQTAVLTAVQIVMTDATVTIRGRSKKPV